MKVLLVDDDPATRLVTTIALEDGEGAEVIVAEGGSEVVETAKREKPDVILLDLVMPDVDGPEVLKRLKADVATREMPVIFHTAKNDPSDVRRLLALGANGVISKPFDPTSLIEEIRRILRSSPSFNE